MYIVSLLFARVGVLKPVIIPECGGLSRRRHEGGSERGLGGGCTPKGQSVTEG